MLDTIKLLLGLADTTKDNLLNILIEQAKEEAIGYTNNPVVADKVNIISQMVVYKYNLLGTEGLKSESYNGVSFNYTTDYPEGIVRELKRYKKLGVITND